MTHGRKTARASGARGSGGDALLSGAALGRCPARGQGAARLSLGPGMGPTAWHGQEGPDGPEEEEKLSCVLLGEVGLPVFTEGGFLLCSISSF